MVCNTEPNSSKALELFRSNMSVQWDVGITKIWPLETFSLGSRVAQLSVMYSNLPGASPLRILQKMQSFLVLLIYKIISNIQILSIKLYFLCKYY